MKKEKVLEIEIKEINEEWSVFYITYQNEDILKREEFEDKELGVYSAISPNMYPHRSTKKFMELFIRGKDKTQDTYVVSIRNKHLSILIDKVKAINEKYGIPKKWRAEYEKVYFYIDSYGKVDVTGDFRRCSDDKRYEIGNYFKTEGEAKNRLEAFKEVFIR